MKYRILLNVFFISIFITLFSHTAKASQEESISLQWKYKMISVQNRQDISNILVIQNKENRKIVFHLDWILPSEFYTSTTLPNQLILNAKSIDSIYLNGKLIDYLLTIKQIEAKISIDDTITRSSIFQIQPKYTLPLLGLEIENKSKMFFSENDSILFPMQILNRSKQMLDFEINVLLPSKGIAIVPFENKGKIKGQEMIERTIILFRTKAYSLFENYTVIVQILDQQKKLIQEKTLNIESVIRQQNSFLQKEIRSPKMYYNYYNFNQNYSMSLFGISDKYVSKKEAIHYQINVQNNLTNHNYRLINSYIQVENSKEKLQIGSVMVKGLVPIIGTGAIIQKTNKKTTYSVWGLVNQGLTLIASNDIGSPKFNSTGFQVSLTKYGVQWNIQSGYIHQTGIKQLVFANNRFFYQNENQILDITIGLSKKMQYINTPTFFQTFIDAYYRKKMNKWSSILRFKNAAPDYIGQYNGQSYGFASTKYAYQKNAFINTGWIMQNSQPNSVLIIRPIHYTSQQYYLHWNKQLNKWNFVLKTAYFNESINDQRFINPFKLRSWLIGKEMEFKLNRISQFTFASSIAFQKLYGDYNKKRDLAFRVQTHYSRPGLKTSIIWHKGIDNVNYYAAFFNKKNEELQWKIQYNITPYSIPIKLNHELTNYKFEALTNQFKIATSIGSSIGNHFSFDIGIKKQFNFFNNITEYNINTVIRPGLFTYKSLRQRKIKGFIDLNKNQVKDEDEVYASNTMVYNYLFNNQSDSLWKYYANESNAKSIVLPMQQLYSYSGKVFMTDSTEIPTQNVEVFLINEKKGFYPLILNHKNEFNLSIPEGNYRIWIGNSQYYLTSSKDIFINNNIYGVLIQIAKKERKTVLTKLKQTL